MGSVFFYDYPIGKVGIAESGGAVTGVFFGFKELEYETRETPAIKETAKQLYEYFGGQRTAFDLPLDLRGTPFQTAVWKALLDVPYGEVRSYKNIAESVGRPKACRAVGMANNRNPVAIIVPCHRVVGHDGSMTGYGGGIPIKEFLLGLEKRRTKEES